MKEDSEAVVEHSPKIRTRAQSFLLNEAVRKTSEARAAEKLAKDLRLQASELELKAVKLRIAAQEFREASAKLA